MDIKKIKVKNPITLSKYDIQIIISDIQSKQINWTYRSEKYDKDYWSITISPNGTIIFPEEDIAGHPDFAEQIIYPNDKLLSMLFNFFRPKDSDNAILMSQFMIFYGYINIDGHTDMSEVKCQYNSQALTVQTRALPDSMKEYSELIDSSSPDISTNQEIADSRMVPFFKRKIIESLMQGDKPIDINKKISEMSNRRKEQLLKDIKKDYFRSLQYMNK